ncbi:L-fucose kinase [Periophthalmus magnuspinnatus]|uniref:L-fucose kinase n=1 Tax=Periophthalmus magnuspinnatus TaxID=409849 RepID=UPI00145B950D|nr:L-fucose kinase [Periophthalmus magnuspinnatus]
MMSPRSEFSWTVVVLTCQHKDSVYSFQKELELRQERGSLSPGALVLTVRDRQEPLGSGGATLNALLVAAEHLSNRAGHTVVTADVLDDAHILILHTGRDFPWSSCCRAFCWIPLEDPDLKVQAPVCCLDLLLDYLTNQICPGSPPGVWVCSTDMMLTLPPDFSLSWEGFSGVRVLALPGNMSYAANHGVYLVDEQGNVRDIVYKGATEQIQQAVMSDGNVPMVSGPVFFSRGVSEKLLQTHVTPPLDGCTYLGLDSGAPPLQISLFLDILKCLCSDQTQHQFVNEERIGCSSVSGQQGALVRSGRTELWKILRGTPLTLVYVPGGQYDYLTLSGKDHMQRLSSNSTNRNTLSHIQKEGLISEGACVINSVLEGDISVGSGAVIQHCHLQGPVNIPTGCLLSGLELSTSSTIRHLALTCDIIIQGHRIVLGELKLNVYTVFGINDNLEVSVEASSALFLNQNWNVFFNRTGIQPEELWCHGEQRCLLGARLFPVLRPRAGVLGLEGGVAWLLGGGANGLQSWRDAWRLSLKEVMSLTHQEAELHWREELLYLSGRRRVRDALIGRSDVCLLPCFRAAVMGGQQGALLETLDNIACGSGAEVSLECPGSELGVSARCLSCIADVLVVMAGGKGGLRSGPAANEAWGSAYILLEEGDLSGGVRALAQQREKWLCRPDLLVRAARHYEGAGQVLLRQAVMSSRRFISIGRGMLPPLEEWQEVHCPARLDLAGGWSDTPPIAFEHGGSVTNVAVKVDGQYPIGARARRIKEPHLLLVSHSGGRDSAVSTETLCESLKDLKDYCQPHAPGALLKAVCVCSGVVSLSSHDALGPQLLQLWGGGIELHSWSSLPTGSGLGTSSILAGALLAAVYRCTGRTYDTDSLIHNVLYLEQILTTGGGWQDQVGGLVGGVKLGQSQAQLPLHVRVQRLNLSHDFLVSLEQHLLLVYTGKTRLARNLLQDVVRSWYSRLPHMVQNAQQLVANAEECAKACLAGSLSGLGACLGRSWQQKKVMAPGCEPASVRLMMEALRPLVLGQSLAGAGGGGFLYILTKLPQQREEVINALNSTSGLGDFSVHSVELDMEGITVVPST